MALLFIFLYETAAPPPVDCDPGPSFLKTYLSVWLLRLATIWSCLNWCIMNEPLECDCDKSILLYYKPQTMLFIWIKRWLISAHRARAQIAGFSHQHGCNVFATLYSNQQIEINFTWLWFISWLETGTPVLFQWSKSVSVDLSDRNHLSILISTQFKWSCSQMSLPGQNWKGMLGETSYLGLFDLHSDDLLSLSNDLHKLVALLHQLSFMHGCVHLQRGADTHVSNTN